MACACGKVGSGQPAETNDFILLTVKTKKINFKFD